MTRSGLAVGAGLSLFALAACEGPSPGLTPLAEAPALEAFALEAGPLLEKRCGDAGCHGFADRPFALFAAGRRRANPADTFIAEPLTDDEIGANLDAVLGFLDTPSVRDSMLLQKALGRLGHGGGAVFAHPTDPEFRAIERALTDSGAEASVE